MTGLLRAALAAIVVLALAAPASGEGGAYWDAGQEIRCPSRLPGCELLQMVMTGSFDGPDCADPQDAVLRRVLASAYPKLCEITEADIAHFVLEFDEDEAAVRRGCCVAMANCLLAEIRSEALPEARLDPARRVLLLFLDPGSQPDAGAQQAQIRGEMTDAAILRLADGVGAPEWFVRWLIDGRE